MFWTRIHLFYQALSVVVPCAQNRFEMFLVLPSSSSTMSFFRLVVLCCCLIHIALAFNIHWSTNGSTTQANSTHYKHTQLINWTWRTMEKSVHIQKPHRPCTTCWMQMENRQITHRLIACCVYELKLRCSVHVKCNDFQIPFDEGENFILALKMQKEKDWERKKKKKYENETVH